MTTTTIENQLMKARMKLLLDFPFYASLALKMDINITRKVKTAATDGKNLFFNPDYFASLDKKYHATIFGHEVLHPAFKHHLRRDSRDPELWNIACDHAINPILKEGGFPLHPSWLYDRRFLNMSAEEIYHILKEEQDCTGESGDEESDVDWQNDENEEDNQDSQQQSSSLDADNEEVTEDGDASGTGEEDGEEGEGSGGGSQDNNQEEEQDEWEPGDGFQGGIGDVMDYPGDDISYEEERITGNVVEAFNHAKMAGKGSPNIERYVDELLHPKVDWETLLLQYVSEKCQDDYTWSKPNRRYVQHGYYLPALESERVVDIVIMTDTSISMTQELLNRVGTACNGIGQIRANRKYVIYCDDAVRGVDEFDPHEDLDLRLKGGGGTDFRPPFEYVKREGLEVKLAIYLTDGWCWDFPPEPDYPVIWALVEENKRFDPPFGDVLLIEY